MAGPPVTGRAAHRERGIFSFVEVLLATLVLALAATATAYWVETVNGLRQDAIEQTVGLALVKTMEGLLQPLPFREPGTSALGPEPGESLADYDDVDDFHGLVASPPLDSDRQPQAEYADWSVRVAVEAVDPATLAADPDGELRRVRIVASHDGREVAGGWWLRARSPLE